MLENGTKDTVRQAGIGGVRFNERYMLSNMTISSRGHTVEIPEIDVRIKKEELRRKKEPVVNLKEEC